MFFFKGAPHQPGGPNFHGHQQGPPMQGLMPGQGPMGRPPGHLGGNYLIYFLSSSMYGLVVKLENILITWTKSFDEESAILKTMLSML